MEINKWKNISKFLNKNKSGTTFYSIHSITFILSLEN